MPIIAVANQKGGTGKTTTAVTMGHKLARNGHRALLVDTDPQGHVSTALGLDKQPGISRLVDWYRDRIDEPLIATARSGLDVIPSNAQTSEAKETLSGMPFSEDFLDRTLGQLGKDYQVIIIDCAPSVDVLHRSAVVAADWLIVPTKLDYLAVDGVNEVVLFLRNVKEFRPEAASLLGVLPTFFDRRTKETAEQLKTLMDTFGDLVLPPIPIDVKLRECPSFGKTIWEYAPDTRSITGVGTRDGKSYGGYERFVSHIEEKVL